MESPPSPRKLNPDCPPELEAVILKILKKQPEDRYANMQELVKALSLILRAYPTPVEQPSKISTASPAPQVELQPPGTKAFGRFLQPLQRLFGGKAEAEPEEQLTPQGQLNIPSEEEATIHLDISKVAAQAVARMVLRDGSGATIELPEKKTLILGRKHSSSAVDIDLEPYQASKYGVSRLHARLVKHDDAWWLDDLHSLNGTFVNDIQVKHGNPVALKEGDIIRFSHMAFVFSLSNS
jgi:hypothetical protein